MIFKCSTILIKVLNTSLFFFTTNIPGFFKNLNHLEIWVIRILVTLTPSVSDEGSRFLLEGGETRIGIFWSCD